MTGQPVLPGARPAVHAPLGLPGLEPAWSRLVPVPDRLTGADVVWHALDTGPLLADAGIAPVGTILAVHGNPTWSYLWRRVLAESLDRALSGGPAWRVIAVDQLEMGYSERSGADRHLPDRVADLGAFTDAIGLAGPVVVLGHDWGGVVASGWAVDHPDLLAGIALTNTAVHQPDGAAVPGALRLALNPAITQRGTVTTTAFLDTTLNIAHPRLEPAVRAAFRAPYQSAALRAGIGAFVRDIPLDPAAPSAAELDRIAVGLTHLDVPALILWGPRDPVFQERYLADLIERLPHAAVHRFEGAGHLLPEDAPVAFSLFTWLAAEFADPEKCRGSGPTAQHAANPSGSAHQDAGSPDPRTPEPLWSALETRARDDTVALVELSKAGAGTVSWRELAARVTALAGGLASIGVQPGDRVSLLVPPGADLTVALYANLRIGAIAVVADAGLGLPGLTRAIRGARPDWIIGIPRALAAARTLRWPGKRILVGSVPTVVERAMGVLTTMRALELVGGTVPDAPEPDAPAAILFTSGSTGPAKGARYTHRQLAAVRDALRAAYGVGDTTGLVAGFAPFALLGPALGARTAVPDMDVTHPSTLTATALAAAVAAVDADTVFLSPAAVANAVRTRGALGDPQLFDGVTTLLSAGAPIGLPLLQSAAQLFPAAAIHTPYGMTESLLVTDTTLADIVAAGDGDGVCVGRPAAGVEVRIAALDAGGAASGPPSTEPGRVGEILVSAPQVFDGYDRLWRTDAAARADAAGARWHRTGDVGHLDADGRLWVEGRLPHVITTADGPRTPVGIEQAAETVPGVSRAAAVGVGPAGTQQVVVVTEVRGARPGLARSALASAVRAAVPFAVAAVLAVPDLPTDIRHDSKIDRARVAAWATVVLSGGTRRL